MSAFAGVVWRHVPVGAVPLHLGKLFKYSEGRWNRRGEFACLYTALTRVGALAELAKARATAGSLATDGDAAHEHCRRLSQAARARGCTALIVPSAAQPGERNLVIYFDVVAPKQVDVDDGPDRETIAFP